MIAIRIFLVVVGVVCVMIGAQLPWGAVDYGDDFVVPVTFFLDIGAIGDFLSVIGVALAALRLSNRLSERAVGAMLVVFGVSIGIGAAVLIAQIDQRALDAANPELEFAPEEWVLGPGGFVALAGGLVIAIAGLLTMLGDTLPLEPPVLPDGGPGEVPSGWYPLHRGGAMLGFWNGTRWTHSRHRNDDW